MQTHSFLTKICLLSRIYHYHLSFPACLSLLSPADSLQLYASNKALHLLHNYPVHKISPKAFPYFFPYRKCLFNCENNSVIFWQSGKVLLWALSYFSVSLSHLESLVANMGLLVPSHGFKQLMWCLSLI